MDDANEETKPAITAPGVRYVIEHLAAEGQVRSRLDDTVHGVFPVGISPAEVDALAACVANEAVEATIEVGLGYGLSGLAICEGMLRAGRRPQHVAIDPYQESRFRNCGLQVLDDAGLRAHVEHISDRSEIALPNLLAEQRSFGFGFVDGNHRFDGVFLDLFYLGQLVVPGGAIFVDDYQLPGIAKACAFYIQNLNWRIEERGESDVFHHWVVLRLPREPVDRAFDYFIDF